MTEDTTDQTNETEKYPNSRPKRDMLPISPESSEKLKGWLAQLNARKEIHVSRAVLLNWIIEIFPEKLSSKDLNSGVDRFYSPDAVMRRLLRERKAAKASGESDDLIEIVIRSKKTPDLEP